MACHLQACNVAGDAAGMIVVNVVVAAKDDSEMGADGGD